MAVVGLITPNCWSVKYPSSSNCDKGRVNLLASGALHKAICSAPNLVVSSRRSLASCNVALAKFSSVVVAVRDVMGA